MTVVYCLLFLSSCNSYLSIEKRRYMDGFYSEQDLFLHEKEDSKFISIQGTQSEHGVTQRNPDFVFSADASAFSAVNNNESKNILIENNSIQFNKMVFHHDTLKKKKKKHGNFKFDERYDTTSHIRKTNIFAILGLVVSVAALLYFPAQIIAFILSTIGIKQIDKHPDKYDGRTLALIGSIISGVILGLLGALYLVGLFF